MKTEKKLTSGLTVQDPTTYAKKMAQSELGVFSASTYQTPLVPKEEPVSENAELINVLTGLISYGCINMVTGVRYAEGTHEELIDKARQIRDSLKKPKDFATWLKEDAVPQSKSILTELKLVNTQNDLKKATGLIQELRDALAFELYNTGREKERFEKIEAAIEKANNYLI